MGALDQEKQMHYKCNANLISHQSDINKIYLHVKYQHEPKYLLLISKREYVAQSILMILKLLLNIQVILMICMKIFMSTNQIINAKYWLHLVLWLLICLAISNLNKIVIELFIRSRKTNISFAFITQSSFEVPKIRLNSTHESIMKFRNIQELQEIAINHSSDANFKDFMKLFKKCFPKPDNI